MPINEEIISRHMKRGCVSFQYLLGDPELALSALATNDSVSLAVIGPKWAVVIPTPETEEDLVTLIRILKVK